MNFLKKIKQKWKPRYCGGPFVLALGQNFSHLVITPGIFGKMSRKSDQYVKERRFYGGI